ncbi:MAG: hypothetical protein E7167_01010 [Firmicutes bacterium]|nr:hypothetical protein [Bacillota bacterium]
MKYNRYTPILVVIIALISFACLSLGISYSYVTRSKVSGNALIITTGDLTSTISYTTTDYAIGAMSDERGLAQNDYGIIEISKDNVYSIFYTMNIGYAMNSLPNGATVDNLIPMEYINVALFPMTGSTVSSTPEIGPVSLADLVISSSNTNSIFNNAYLLNYGIFDAGNQSTKYAMKVWLDEDIPLTYDGGLVYLGVNVEQETLVSKTLYNLKGVVKYYDSDEDKIYAADDAIVKLQNGKLTSIVSDNSEYMYSLENVPTGTYNISVLFREREYKTTIHVKTGDTPSLQSTTQAIGQVGTFIQNSAYTYYTSPGAILSANNLKNNSNSVATSSYTIPKAYILTGIESLSIKTAWLVLYLNEDGTIDVQSMSVDGEVFL